jgi:hypothetical protein
MNPREKLECSTIGRNPKAEGCWQIGCFLILIIGFTGGILTLIYFALIA